MEFATRAIHAGYHAGPENQFSANPPIIQTSLFVHEHLGADPAHSYSRVSNPTRSAAEAALASLENATHALAFGSGMAAIDAIFRATLKPGDEVIAVADIYGGAYRLLTRIYAPAGVTVRFLDLTDPANLAAALTPAVKLVWLESPTNPLLKLVDIEAITTLAHAAGVPVAIDNTFASPYLQNPLDFGVDFVMHSATKYLGGHSDVVMGMVAVRDEARYQALRLVLASAGNVPGPMDCYLVHRGMKTLALRMQRHCENAQVIAEFLQSHPAIEQVFYPGLPSHPQHALACRQMRGFGGVVSIYLKENSQAAAARVANRLQLFLLGESLGGVESIVNHSASMSHGSMPAEVKAQAGIREGLLRLSIGIEDVNDLLADLRQALA